MRVGAWFRDRALRRVVNYGVPVAIGRIVTSVAGLVTTAFLARHLGPELFGVLAVIRTLVTTVEQYANFNTWQALIKYGAEAIAAGDIPALQQLIKLSFTLDAATAALATVVIGGLAYAIPSAFDWTSQESALCTLYAVTILTRIGGMPDGVYRLCDAYRPQAIITSISAAIMTVLVGIAVALDASFAGCVLALVIGEVIGNILPLVVAIKVARERGYGGWWKSSLAGTRARFPGIARFLISTSAQLTVKKSQSDVDTFVIGAMLGKIPSGLFRVVKQLGSIPGRVFMPFEQVLFTELAKSVAAHRYGEFRRLLFRIAMVVGVGSLAIWAVAAVLAGPTLRLIAGADYTAAAPAFRWYLLAMVLNVMNTPVQRAMIALGRPGTLFWFDLSSLGVVIAGTIIGAHAGGLVGVSIAIVIHKVVQTAWSTLLVAKISRDKEAQHARGLIAGDADPEAPPPPAPGE